jgi:superfamily I DNA/RNA helicase
MGAKQRDRLWPVFQDTRKELVKRELTTGPQLFAQLTEFYRNRDKPFDHVVVDEAQDLGVAELRFLVSIAGPIPNALFFAGDLAQRIFQQPFSWKSLGVDIRGRSVTLKVNYRTSHQIRTAADQILPPVVHDVDRLEESRFGTVSVFNGPEPSVELSENREREAARAAAWIKDAISAGLAPADIAIFVRTTELLERARTAARDAGFGVSELSGRARDREDTSSIGTMHLAKGLEFKGVIVMGFDDDVLPLQSRVDEVADEVELDEV